MKQRRKEAKTSTAARATPCNLHFSVSRKNSEQASKRVEFIRLYYSKLFNINSIIGHQKIGQKQDTPHHTFLGRAAGALYNLCDLVFDKWNFIE